MRKREIAFPTIIGILVALGGLVSGLWLIREQTRQAAKALEEEGPRKIVVSNLNDSGFTLSWTTQKTASGYVVYSEGGNELTVSDERDQLSGNAGSYLTHYVNIRGLKPETVYQYKIGSGKNLYFQSGSTPYQIKTPGQLANPPPADIAYGQVLSESGDPAEGALVYLQIPNATMQSGLVKSTGAWVIPLATARSLDLKNYVEYNREAEILSIQVEGGQLGTGAVKVKTADDSPVPNIVLGKTYDFTASAGEEVTSKFAPPGGNLMTEEKVRIISPRMGEKINSTKPEIIGKAPVGTKVTIEIHSDTAVKGSVVTDKNGDFSYTIPTDLPPGEHTVTASVSINGVVQKISKTFTVYAAGESGLPAFSATPSATLIPTKKPTPTPTTKPVAMVIPTKAPTATPRPTVTPTPTKKPTTPTPASKPSPTAVPGVTVKPTATVRPTVTVRPTATIVPTKTSVPTKAVGGAGETTIPVSGNDSWTWLTLGLGLVMTVSGWWWYRKAE